MAPDTDGAIMASAKRKYAIDSLDRSFVYFRASKWVISVNEDLVDERCGGSGWRSRVNHKCNIRRPQEGFIHDAKTVEYSCADCPHSSTQWHHSMCIFRGFIYWLKLGKLPCDESIKKGDYPAEWKDHVGDKPLALAMAMELYRLAWHLKLPRLSLSMLQFVFAHVKETRSLPGVNWLCFVYAKVPSLVDSPLRRFLVDVYYKWCGTVSEISRQDDYPLQFLLDMLEMRAKRNKLSAGKEKEDSLVLRLSDYHCDGSEKFCPTKDGDTGDTWVIR